MSRYIGPKYKLIKSLGFLPALGPRESLCNKPKKIRLNRIKRDSEYKKRLKEKQKIRYNYGVSETQLSKLVTTFCNFNSKTQNILLSALEMRLDNIIFRFGFTLTIAQARQLINHGKIYVNFKRLTIPSYFCKKFDIIFLDITCSQKKQIQNIMLKKQNFSLSNLIYLFTPFYCQILNLIESFQIKLKINERLIIEFYSR